MATLAAWAKDSNMYLSIDGRPVYSHNDIPSLHSLQLPPSVHGLPLNASFSGVNVTPFGQPQPTVLPPSTRFPVPVMQPQNWILLGDQIVDTPPPRKRRKGGKIYSGCATCHQRKIKCDQRRPTCNNCAKSRQYICSGYESNDAAACSTESALVGNFQEPKADASPHNTTSSGNSSPEGDSREFEHLAWNGSGAEAPGKFIDPAAQANDAMDTSGFLSCLHAAFPDGSFEFSFTPETVPLNDFLPWPKSTTIENNDQGTMQSNKQKAVLSGPEGNNARTPEVFEVSGTNLLSMSASDSSPCNSLVEFTGLPKTTRELLHHYRTHVCQLMMPTAAPSQNPWLQLYLPGAIQDQKTPQNQALLNAILAVSAFNLSSLRRGDSRSYRLQALEHTEKAAQHMKAIKFGSPSPESTNHDKANKQAALAAALTMTTIEVFSGGNEGKCHRYLRTAKEIIERTGGIEWWLLDPASTTLLQIFRCLRIVSDTAGWSEPSSVIQDKSQSSNDRDSHTVYEVAGTGVRDDELITTSTSRSYKYTLDVSFGISMRTLWCLNKIVELASIKSAAPRGSCWWEAHQGDLLKLDAEIFDAMDDPYAFTECDSLVAQPVRSEEVSSPSYDNTHSGASEIVSGYSSTKCGIPQIVTEEIRENHLWAFHYAVALFYRRAICGGGTSTSLPIERNLPGAPRPSGQYLVSKVLEHLENIDALTVDTPVANTLWPGFIAAVEAVDTELRHRVLGWFARAKRHGIDNIPAAKTLVLEAWRRVDRQTYDRHDRKDLRFELGPVDWRTIMREKGMYIMLT